MANQEDKSLQPVPKDELAKAIEQTRSGHLFNPAVDIFESDVTITLLADLPGVKPEDLSVDLKEDVLTITACFNPSEKNNETELLKEYEEGSYYRQFALTQEIDQKKIDAQLVDGVLHLTMHKVEKAIPRKIEVNAG
jgi:HSP20 family molecular chaperone IbpA